MAGASRQHGIKFGSKMVSWLMDGFRTGVVRPIINCTLGGLRAIGADSPARRAAIDDTRRRCALQLEVEQNAVDEVSYSLRPAGIRLISFL